MANDALLIRGLEAGYGAARALDGVSIDVGAGEAVALLGAKGNGKSTLMKCILGLVKPWAGEIRATIGSRSAILSRLETEEIVGLGVVIIPEEAAGYSRTSASKTISRLARIGGRRGDNTRKISPAALRSFRVSRRGASNASA